MTAKTNSAADQLTPEKQKRNIEFHSEFKDKSKNSDRKVRAAIYLTYSSEDEPNTLLAVVPRTLRVYDKASTHVIASGEKKAKMDEVGTVEPCDLPAGVFSRIRLDSDVVPELPAAFPAYADENGRIEPDVRVSEDVFLVNDSSVPVGGDPEPIGYLVAQHTEVSLFFDDAAADAQNMDNKLVEGLHVIQATHERYLDFMGRILCNSSKTQGVLGAVIAANTDRRQLIVAPLPIFPEGSNVSVYRGEEYFGNLSSSQKAGEDSDYFASFDDPENVDNPFHSKEADGQSSDELGLLDE